MKNAQFGMGQDAYEGSIRVTGQNALLEGDAMSFWIDKQSLMMRRLEIDTLLDKKPVTVVAEYQSLPNGPNYQARATLEYPKEKVQVLIENFGHQPLQPAAGSGAQGQATATGAPPPSQPATQGHHPHHSRGRSRPHKNLNLRPRVNQSHPRSSTTCSPPSPSILTRSLARSSSVPPVLFRSARSASG